MAGGRRTSAWGARAAAALGGVWLAALAIWRFGQVEEKWDTAMIKGPALRDDAADIAESSDPAADLAWRGQDDPEGSAQPAPRTQPEPQA